MRKSLLYFSIVLLSISFTSCSLFEKDEDNSDKPSYQGVVYKDLIYKNAGGQDLKLDILMPTDNSTSKAPVVVYLHGGAWITGDRHLIDEGYIADITKALRNNGFAVVTVDFRQLLGDLSFPINISDGKDAVRWVRKNADSYNLDANSIGFWGTSSGGHLALMAAYSDADYTDDTNSVPADLQSFSSSVKYVIDNFAPSNLHQFFITNTDSEINVLAITNPSTYTEELQMVLDALHVNPKSEYFTAEEMSLANSPVSYLDNSVPTLIMHGTSDDVVHINQSRELRDSLINRSADYEYYEYQNVNHSFLGASADQLSDIETKTVNFALAHK